MEGKLDAVLSEMRGSLRSLSVTVKDHDTRILRLEETEAERTGAVKAARWLWGLITALIGLVMGTLGGHIIR